MNIHKTNVIKNDSNIFSEQLNQSRCQAELERTFELDQEILFFFFCNNSHWLWFIHNKLLNESLNLTSPLPSIPDDHRF